MPLLDRDIIRTHLRLEAAPSTDSVLQQMQAFYDVYIDPVFLAVIDHPNPGWVNPVPDSIAAPSDTQEDAYIDLLTEAAEQAAMKFMNRVVYANDADLQAAIAASATTLTTANTMLDTAVAAANLMTREYERDEALNRARLAHLRACGAVRAIQDGIVVNAQIKSAMLLTLGHLYLNREDVVAGTTAEQLPRGAASLLMPFRIGMGI